MRVFTTVKTFENNEHYQKYEPRHLKRLSISRRNEPTRATRITAHDVIAVLRPLILPLLCLIYINARVYKECQLTVYLYTDTYDFIVV